MALYLGSSKMLNVSCSDGLYHLNFFSAIPITNGIRLLSSDGYILKDSNGLYLTTHIPIKLLSSDGYFLKDFNELYLTIKESD